MREATSKPRTVSENSINYLISNDPMDWDSFVADIVAGKYALMVGSEVMLKEQLSGGDSSKHILNHVLDKLKRANILVQDFTCNSFTELSRRMDWKSDSIRKLITDSLLNTYRCSQEDISSELKKLLRTKFFRIVMTTTFDPYLEDFLKDIWRGEGLRVRNIYDKNNFDLDVIEQSADEFGLIRPTLYYMCGKGGTNLKYTATDNDAIRTVAKWLGNDAPQNFLKHIQSKGVISIGCKFEDWLFRFFWYAIRRRIEPKIEQDENKLQDAVAVSFASESQIAGLQNYLRSNNTYTETDARGFINKILNTIDNSKENFSSDYSQYGGVFISYAHEDFHLVAGFARKLKEAKINVWFDAVNLNSGNTYNKKIYDAISQCKVFIPILSPQIMSDMSNSNTLEERYYYQEWQWAKQAKECNDIAIMPAAISGYDPSSEYHKKNFLFKNSDSEDITVINLLLSPISEFVCQIKKELSNQLNKHKHAE